MTRSTSKTTTKPAAPAEVAPVVSDEIKSEVAELVEGIVGAEVALPEAFDLNDSNIYSRDFIRQMTDDQRHEYIVGTFAAIDRTDAGVYWAAAHATLAAIAAGELKRDNSDNREGVAVPKAWGQRYNRSEASVLKWRKIGRMIELGLTRGDADYNRLTRGSGVTGLSKAILDSHATLETIREAAHKWVTPNGDDRVKLGEIDKKGNPIVKPESTLPPAAEGSTTVPGTVVPDSTEAPSSESTGAETPASEKDASMTLGEIDTPAKVLTALDLFMVRLERVLPHMTDEQRSLAADKVETLANLINPVADEAPSV